MVSFAISVQFLLRHADDRQLSDIQHFIRVKKVIVRWRNVRQIRHFAGG